MTATYAHEDWFSRNIPYWTHWLAHLRGMPDVHALEIGSFEGRSAVWLLENILTNSTSTLRCVDPFTEEAMVASSINVVKDAEATKAVYTNFVNNVLKPFSSKAVLLKEPARRALPHLPIDFFDLVYIDGSHKAGDTVMDAVLSWPLMRPGGILIFDDYTWEDPKLAIDGFLVLMKPHLEIVQLDRQVCVRKVS